jgi:hypothetical protein
MPATHHKLTTETRPLVKPLTTAAGAVLGAAGAWGAALIPSGRRDTKLRCVVFVSAGACQSRVNGKTVFLLFVGLRLVLATDMVGVLHGLAAVMRWHIARWLTATKTPYRTSASTAGTTPFPAEP